MICKKCGKKFKEFTWYKCFLCPACFLQSEDKERIQQEHLLFDIDGKPLDESYMREVVVSEATYC